MAPSSPTSGNNASVATLGNNPNRVGLVIVNLDSANVFTCPDSAGAASATNGILLAPNGGNVTVRVDEDGPLSEFGWNTFCATKAAQLFVIEIIGGP